MRYSSNVALLVGLCVTASSLTTCGKPTKPLVSDKDAKASPRLTTPRAIRKECSANNRKDPFGLFAERCITEKDLMQLNSNMTWNDVNRVLGRGISVEGGLLAYPHRYDDALLWVIFKPEHDAGGRARWEPNRVHVALVLKARTLKNPGKVAWPKRFVGLSAEHALRALSREAPPALHSP